MAKPEDSVVRELTEKIKSHTFFKYPITANKVVPPSVMEELAYRHSDNVARFGTLETRIDNIIGGLIVTLRSYLLQSQHVEKTYLRIEVPKTWWDHLKHDWQNSPKGWQRWVASRLAPPAYRTESKSVSTLIRLCPHNDYYLSEKPEAHFDFLEGKDF